MHPLDKNTNLSNNSNYYTSVSLIQHSLHCVPTPAIRVNFRSIFDSCFADQVPNLDFCLKVTLHMAFFVAEACLSPCGTGKHNQG